METKGYVNGNWNGSDENGRNVPLYGLNNYRFFTVYCIRVN